jgi:hypothetical protein
VYTILKYGKEIEEQVINLRRQCDIIVEIIGKESKEEPSKSWINKKLTEYGLNKMTDEIKKEHKRIIKERVGELGHMDSHYLPKNIIKEIYLISVIMTTAD